MANNPELQAKLDLLLNRYCSQLPNRQKEIDALWQSVCQQQAMGDEGRELHRLVHSLAGSGASFGFAALSETAKSFELLLKECCDGDLIMDSARQQLMERERLGLYEALNKFAEERA
ncbi:MAG: Hpt domain-containing protein [Gammaproteobacteria bacterium]|nr:Hpt domain-containing protein [Gammaproteobacteria bacterium]MCF6230151.1 Hpt domain-containing protein [Gammaproteobacteria bacterium]